MTGFLPPGTRSITITITIPSLQVHSQQCGYDRVFTSRYSVKMTLCKPDSKYSSRSRMALHSFIFTLDYLNRSLVDFGHLVQDLQLVPGVGHVVGPGVLLVLGSKHLFVGFPLGINLYIPQEKKTKKQKRRSPEPCKLSQNHLHPAFEPCSIAPGELEKIFKTKNNDDF